MCVKTLAVASLAAAITLHAARPPHAAQRNNSCCPRREAAEDAYEFDLGNLAAFNPHPLDAAAFQADRNAACQAEAARVFQALAARLFQLESEPAPVGRLACLPEPTTVLPREKPLPKPREPTKWELFAQRKGIQKRKRSALEWDDVTQEWRRRHGYKRAAGANDLPPVVEAGVGDQVWRRRGCHLQWQRSWLASTTCATASVHSLESCCLPAGGRRPLRQAGPGQEGAQEEAGEAAAEQPQGGGQERRQRRAAPYSPAGGGTAGARPRP